MSRHGLRLIRDKDARRVVQEAVSKGFSVDASKGGGHPRIRDPRGRIVAVCPCTNSDHRGVANLIADLRRAGLVWPPVGKKPGRMAS
jgi:hypothetical protein